MPDEYFTRRYLFWKRLGGCPVKMAVKWQTNRCQYLLVKEQKTKWKAWKCCCVNVWCSPLFNTICGSGPPCLPFHLPQSSQCCNKEEKSKLWGHKKPPEVLGRRPAKIMNFTKKEMGSECLLSFQRDEQKTSIGELWMERWWILLQLWGSCTASQLLSECNKEKTGGGYVVGGVGEFSSGWAKMSLLEGAGLNSGQCQRAAPKAGTSWVMPVV